MNEPPPRASVVVMDPTLPDPTPEALQQALADPGFAPVAEALRAVLARPNGVDVVDAVMEAIALDAQMSTLGPDLRSVLPGSPEFDLAGLGGFDVADLVMGAIEADRAEMEISAYFDGEIPAADRTVVARRMMRDAGARAQVSAHAELAGALRDAVHGAPDLWAGVAHAIGADVEDDQGWSTITAALRDGVTAEPIDVADAVMASLAAVYTHPRRISEPASRRWINGWGPVMAFAAAAAVVFSLLPSTPPPAAPLPAPAVAEAQDFQLAKVNDAEVEDMEYAQGVQGGIIQPQVDGEPLVIVVDDSALLAAADVPSGTHL